jgi:Polyketide cyclase / dehydrase and lipid transport
MCPPVRGRAEMDEVDLVDEGLIDADPVTVYLAIRDLVQGKAQWWAGVEIRPRGEIGPDLVGAVFDMIVHRLPAGRSTLRILEARENEMHRYEYVDGPELGIGTLILTPVRGGTRVSYRQQVRPQRRMLRLLARLGVVPRIHRRYMHAYFEGLRTYVERENGRPSSR